MTFSSNIDSKKNEAFITPFTICHFLTGVIANLVSQKFKLTFTNGFILWFFIHLLYEIKDYYFSYVQNIDNYIFDNSFKNSVGNQIFAMLGFLAGQKVSENI